MWRWDQGHLSYFEFTALRRTAEFAVRNDLKSATRDVLRAATGLDFSAPPTHSPWRNYSRVFKVALLASDEGDAAKPTAVATVLARPGSTTSDEYFHFLARVTTDPSPALQGYSADADFRYPILFSLKYLLAKAALDDERSASFAEIIAAYQTSMFTGDESDEAFIQLVQKTEKSPELDKEEIRQAKESLLVFSQISYLYADKDRLTISLDPIDAREVFADMTALTGPFAERPGEEIQRRAALFAGGSDQEFSYSHTIASETAANGFLEGGKVRQTHLVIERNRQLRSAFFAAHPTTRCDVCSLDTKQTYPWTDGVLDLHHLLPLASGTRMRMESGTDFADLVPVCPTCHRAIHRFYDSWLIRQQLADFVDAEQARQAYADLKSSFPGVTHA